MNMILAGIFCVAGAALGFCLLPIAKKIALYKCSKKNMAVPSDLNCAAPLLKLALCILNGAVWLVSFFLIENIVAAALSSILFSLAVLIAIIDLRIRIVPNELLLIMILVGIPFQMINFGVSAALISVLCMAAMIIFFISVAFLVGFDKVGAGDVKLAGAMGLALGYPNIITALVIMSAVFLVYSAGGLIIKKLTMKSMLPFAPFMMCGMIFTLTYIMF